MLLNKEIFREPLIPVTIRDQTSLGNETKIREQKARSFYKICRNVSRILRGIISITQDRRNFDRFCKATILSTKMFCICKCNSLFFIAIFVSNAKKNICIIYRIVLRGSVYMDDTYLRFQKGNAASVSNYTTSRISTKLG